MRKNSARNSLFSLLSLLFPVVLGLVFIPHFIREFGNERFSFLSIIWAFFGYFSFLDLGIGRTLTKIIASEKTKSSTAPSYSFVMSAQYIIFTLSLLFSALIYVIAEPVILGFLKTSPEYHVEFTQSLHIVALGIPLVTMTSLNRSILEGFNDFYRANILQVLVGVFLFVLPYFFWKIHPSMISICASIVIGRIVVYGLSHYFYKRQLPTLPWVSSDLFPHFKMLMSHGVWLTVSNVLAPIMSNFDKVLLGNITVLKNVAFYTTPMEMISRLWAIPNAVTRIFFPQFAAAETDDVLRDHFRSAREIMGLFIFPVCLVVFVFAKELLDIWIGVKFSAESYPLAQWMVIGILFNAFNWIPVSWLQATRHVKWSVYIVLLEVPLFLVAFYYFTEKYGLIGSAAVWSGRLIGDYLITYSLTIWFRPILSKEFVSSLIYLTASVVTMGAITAIPSLALKVMATLLSIAVFVVINRKLIKEMLVR